MFTKSIFLISKFKHNPKRIDYIYRNNSPFYKSMFIITNRFNKEELLLIDNLFENLDKSNLEIIKGIINNNKKNV